RIVLAVRPISPARRPSNAIGSIEREQLPDCYVDPCISPAGPRVDDDVPRMTAGRRRGRTRRLRAFIELDPDDVDAVDRDALAATLRTSSLKLDHTAAANA